MVRLRSVFTVCLLPLLALAAPCSSREHCDKEGQVDEDPMDPMGASPYRPESLSEEDRNAVIYVSFDNEVQSIPMFTPSNHGNQTFVSTNDEASSLALDVQGRRLFAAMETRTHDQYLAVVEHGQIKKLKDVDEIRNVAVDWVGGNVVISVGANGFWQTDAAPSHLPGIYLCTVDALHCRRIIQGRSGKPDGKVGQGYRGLAVNSLLGLVAWVDVNSETERIMMANLNGSGVVTVVDQNVRYPGGIAFDIVKNEIYFGLWYSRSIEKVNLESGRRTTVARAVGCPVSLAYFDNRIYWTDLTTESVRSASTVGQLPSTPRFLYASPDHNPYGLEVYHNVYGIVVNHSLAQPSLRPNPCDAAACPWMCVVVRVRDDVYDSSAALEARCVHPDEDEDNQDL